MRPCDLFAWLNVILLLCSVDTQRPAPHPLPAIHLLRPSSPSVHSSPKRMLYDKRPTMYALRDKDLADAVDIQDDLGDVHHDDFVDADLPVQPAEKVTLQIKLKLGDHSIPALEYEVPKWWFQQIHDEHVASVRSSAGADGGSGGSGQFKSHRKVIKTTIQESSGGDEEDSQQETPRFAGHVRRKPEKFASAHTEITRHETNSGASAHGKPDKFAGSGAGYTRHSKVTTGNEENEEMEEEGTYNEDCGGEAEYFAHRLGHNAFTSPLTKPQVAATANWNSNDPFVFQGRQGFTGPGDDYYLQISFGSPRRVTGWRVTGNGHKNQAGAVEAYTVRLYDPGQHKWTTYTGPEGQPRVFSGAPSADPARTGDVYPVKIVARKADGIRFYPIQWSGKPYFKVDVQACKDSSPSGRRAISASSRKHITTVTEEEEEDRSRASRHHPKPQAIPKGPYNEMKQRSRPYPVDATRKSYGKQHQPVESWSKHPAGWRGGGTSNLGGETRKTKTLTEEWSKHPTGYRGSNGLGYGKGHANDDRSSRMRNNHLAEHEYVAGEEGAGGGGGASKGSAWSKRRKITTETREQGASRGAELPKEPHAAIEPSVERIPGGPHQTICKRIPLRDLQYFEIDYDKRVQNLGAEPDIMADGYVNLRLLTAKTSQQNKNNHIALEVDFGRTRPIQQLFFKGTVREGMPAIMQAFYLQFYDADTHVWQWVSQDNQPKPFVLFQQTQLNKKEVQTIFPVRFTESIQTSKMRLYPELWINLPVIRMGVIACG